MNDKLIKLHIVEKAKRRAQSMLWESFSGVNGKSYLDCYDSKLKTDILYIPQNDISINYKFFRPIEVRTISETLITSIHRFSNSDWLNFQHGSLYLPYPYVCSTSSKNSRFSGEQYYWDSYLYVLSLLSFDQIEDAKGIVKNLCYELDHYGMILNGNRTYYLGRSQPPFLSTMVMAIYTHLVDNRKAPLEGMRWIIDCKPYIKKELSIWNKYGMKEIEFDNTIIQLATYFDIYNKICPEAIDESGYPDCVLGSPLTKYEYSIIKKFKADLCIKINSHYYFDDLNIDLNSIPCEIKDLYLEKIENKTISIKHDVAQRASGFDPCDTAFENRCADIASVSLNSLLYKTMDDLEMIGIILKNGSEIHKWRKKKNELANSIKTFLWNNDTNIYQNRSIINKKFMKEPFITTIYPMMFGLASDTQAESIATFIMKGFLTEYGIKNVITTQHNQWDNIWGIMNYFVNKGFRMYSDCEIKVSNKSVSLDSLANEVAIRFLNNIISVFDRTGTFFEKYNPKDGSENFIKKHYGNQSEFSWTAASFLALLTRIT